MSRSLTQRAFALGLVALFHVAMLQDVVMLLCVPVAGAEQVASHEHHGDSHAAHTAPTPEPENPEQAPSHDHGSCNYCCTHGPADVGRLPTLHASHEGPGLDFAPAELAELRLSLALPHNTLPIPPPVV
jgi:hypothetical protein